MVTEENPKPLDLGFFLLHRAPVFPLRQPNSQSV